MLRLIHVDMFYMLPTACLFIKKNLAKHKTEKGLGNLRVVELRVASCELRVASCRFGFSTVLFYCALKNVNWCWESK